MVKWEVIFPEFISCLILLNIHLTPNYLQYSKNTKDRVDQLELTLLSKRIVDDCTVILKMTLLIVTGVTVDRIKIRTASKPTTIYVPIHWEKK